MTEADLPSAFDCMARAFGLPPWEGAVKDRMAAGLELPRMMVARDGGTVVGTAGAYSLLMSLPGVRHQPVAGVTMVSVAATHRRQGVLTALMQHQLHSLVAGRGEAVAALWSSEAPIYPHFGYAAAAPRQRIEIPLGPQTAYSGHGRSLLAEFATGGGVLRQGSFAADAAVLCALYDATSAERPGMLVRSPGGRSWDRLALRDNPELVIAEGQSGPLGYAAYKSATQPSNTFARNGEVSVLEVVSADRATYAALWRFLLDLDLMSTLVSTNRPLPDPLAPLLVNPRLLNGLVGDCLWLRIVDLPRALAQRAYAAPVDLVLDVTDPLLTGNAGRWHVRVAAGGEKAVVTPADHSASPDLSLDVSQLSGVHLGAVSVAELALAGLVTEHTPGSVAAASAAWSWSPVAWCPEIF